MTPTALLEELKGQGFTLRPEGPANLRVEGPTRLPEPLRSQVVACKPAILALLTAPPLPEALAPAEAVAWRVAAMRSQLRPGAPLPVLVARPLAEWGEADCLSCGDALPAGHAYRCGPCLEAARIVAREALP